MPSADALITRDGPVAAPLQYQVPASGDIIPLVVTAVVDGTGAGSSFLPTLQILAPNGAVVARCPVSSSIAAAGSAEVSWFPGVAAGASSGPTLAAQVVRAFGTTGIGDVPNIPAGGSALVSFTTVATSDATKAAWGNLFGTTNGSLSFKQPANGWVLVQAACSWPTATKIDCRVFSPNGYDFIHDGFDSFSGYDTAMSATGAAPKVMDLCVLDIPTVNADVPIMVRLTNSGSAPAAPDAVHVNVTYFNGLGI